MQNLLNKSFLIKNIFLSLFIATLSSCDLFSNKVLNQTVVSVENYKMTTQELSKALAYKLKNLDALSAKDPQVISQFKEKIISDFIVEAYMLLWFEEKKLSVTDKEVDAEVTKLVGDYPDDSSFRQTLSEEGMTFAQWRSKIEIGLKRKKIFSFLSAQVQTPSDAELESFYQNNKSRFIIKEAVLASHVLVADENQAEIVKKLSKTQKFSDLVKKFSMSSDAKDGGSYGWVEKDSTPDFERLFKAKTSEIIGPIKLSDGYHLFYIEQKRISRPKSFIEAKDQIKNEVIALRETARFSAWLDEQIKRYKVFKNTVVLESLMVETR